MFGPWDLVEKVIDYMDQAVHHRLDKGVPLHLQRRVVRGKLGVIRQFLGEAAYKKFKRSIDGDDPDSSTVMIPSNH